MTKALASASALDGDDSGRECGAGAPLLRSPSLSLSLSLYVGINTHTAMAMCRQARYISIRGGLRALYALSTRGEKGDWLLGARIAPGRLPCESTARLAAAPFYRPPWGGGLQRRRENPIYARDYAALASARCVFLSRVDRGACRVGTYHRGWPKSSGRKETAAACPPLMCVCTPEALFFT